MPSDNDAHGPLHLVPLGNLASLLVPVALVSANVMWHAFGPSPLGGEDASTPSVGLSVLLEPDGYVVTTGDGGMVTVTCGGCADPHDESELRRQLRRIKNAHPSATTVVVVPDQTSSYALLMRTLKATREDAEGELFPQAIIAGTGE